jgi:hypothetical protein
VQARPSILAGESSSIQGDLEALCKRFEELEALTLRAASLSQKIPGRSQLVAELLRDPDGGLSPTAVLNLATAREEGLWEEVAGIAALFSGRRRKKTELKTSPGNLGPVSIGRKPSAVEYVLVQRLKDGLESDEKAGEAQFVNRLYVESTQGALLAAVSLWKPAWPRIT